MGCGSNSASPSDTQLQSTVDTAVQATTDALNAPTSTPTVVPSATPLPDENSETEASEAVAETAVDEESEPPTPTPIPTITNTPTPAPTATPEAPFIKTEQDDGSVRYDLPFEGFALTLPSDWLVADLTENIESSTPSELEQIMGSRLFQGLVGSGLKFYGLNWSEASRSSGNPANINIAELPANGVTSVNDFGTETITRLTYEFELETEEISQTETTVGGLPAIRLDYFREAQSPTGTKTNLQGVQYIVLVNDKIYTIVITMPADLAPSLLPDTEAAVQNIDFYGN
ncbi:MAG: hypothetical protein AB8G95_09560 [Anaerolineae bacterium]